MITLQKFKRFREVEARLKSRGVDYIGPIPQLPGLVGIYFYDPNLTWPIGGEVFDFGSSK
jgi:hypothetical protein